MEKMLKVCDVSCQLTVSSSVLSFALSFSAVSPYKALLLPLQHQVCNHVADIIAEAFWFLVHLQSQP